MSGMQVGGEEYLNQSESLVLLGVRHKTFKSIEEKTGLKSFTFPNRPRVIFYRKSDLERIRDTPQERKGK